MARNRTTPAAASVAHSASKTPRWPFALAVGGIAAAAVLAYLPSFAGVFVFDDEPGILRNTTLHSLGRALRPPPDTPLSGRPVANLSLALNYAVSGLQPWSYHALNLLIHVLAGLTLFGIVRRTAAWAARPHFKVQVSEFKAAVAERGVPGESSSDSRITGTVRPTSDERGEGTPPTSATLLGLAAALVWMLHPLQTEAVTYVVQRVESLMALFFLLTLYCFVRYAEAGEGPLAYARSHGNQASGGGERLARARAYRDHALADREPLAYARSHNWRWAVGAIGACLLAVGTKEVAVTIPVLVFLYDRTFVAGSFREAWRRRRWIHLALAATWLPLAALVASTGWNRGGTAGFNVGVSPWAYWLTQLQAVTTYLRLSVWPHPQVFDYPTFWIRAGAEVVPYALVVAALVAGTVWALLRRPVIGFLGAWFLVILAPTSLVPGTIQMIVEHRLYLPLAAVAVGLGCAVERLLGRRGLIALAASAVALGGLAAQRNTVYHSERSLWADTVANCPASETAQNNLGNVLAKAGEYPPAIGHYRAAIQRRPEFADAHYNLGTALAETSGPAEAMAEFARALALNPRMPDAETSLGVALDRSGRPDEAMAHYAAALRIDPDYPKAHNAVGMMLARAGRMPEAIAHFEAAVRVDPRDADAQKNLGLALAGTGRLAEAVPHYEQSLAVDPAQPAVENNLGIALLMQERPRDAIAHFEAALRLDPTLAQVHMNLAAALQAIGRDLEAAAHVAAAKRLGFGGE